MNERTIATLAKAERASPGRWAKVWDAPTRLFHWSIVVLVATSYATGRMGLIDWHFLSGYAILALLLFRLAWGFAGSATARFSRFVRGPRAALHHLAGVARRQPDDGVGHNAAGGLMVVLLLALLLLQATSGLFANDGLFTEGPLAGLVGPAWSDRLSTLHSVVINLILAAVAVHVAAIIIYAALLRQDLVRPMVTGWKRLPPGMTAPALAPLSRALILAALAAGIVYAVSRLG